MGILQISRVNGYFAKLITFSFINPHGIPPILLFIKKSKVKVSILINCRKTEIGAAQVIAP